MREIHDDDPNHSSEAKINTQFYFGLETWSKNALDFAAGGSFLLAPPGEAYLILKNLFDSNMAKKKTLEDMKTLCNPLKLGLRIVLRESPIKETLTNWSFLIKV